ncbi:MAG: hypothetical protein ACK4J0_00340 [Candidatus Anstonellaceae archaeon]
MKKTKNLLFLTLMIFALFFFLSGCLLEEQKPVSEKQNTIKEVEQKINDSIEDIIEPDKNESTKEAQKQTEPKEQATEKPKQTTESTTIEQTEKLLVKKIEKPALDQKNAIKIQVLKKGEKVEIENWELLLEGIEMDNENFYAQYSVYYDGKKIKEFEVQNPYAAELKFDNGKEYIIVVVFPLGEKPNALQTQIYRTKALVQSSAKIEIGQVQNSYVLGDFYPFPKIINSGKLEIGQKINGEGFSVYYQGVDKTKIPLKAQFKITDNEDKEISQIELSNKQMVEIKFVDKTKYALELKEIDKETFDVEVNIYRIISFAK